MKIEITRIEAHTILDTLLIEAYRLRQLEWGQELNQNKAERLLAIATKLQNQGVSVLAIEGSGPTKILA